MGQGLRQDGLRAAGGRGREEEEEEEAAGEQCEGPVRQRQAPDLV